MASPSLGMKMLIGDSIRSPTESRLLEPAGEGLWAAARTESVLRSCGSTNLRGDPVKDTSRPVGSLEATL